MLTCDLSCFYRKKIVNAETLAHSKLSRVMGVLDVTAIGELFIEIKHSATFQFTLMIYQGVSSTVGSGIYVLLGTVI